MPHNQQKNQGTWEYFKIFTIPTIFGRVDNRAGVVGEADLVYPILFAVYCLQQPAWQTNNTDMEVVRLERKLHNKQELFI